MLVHNTSNHTPRKKDHVCQSLSSLMVLQIILLATVCLLLKKKKKSLLMNLYFLKFWDEL